MVFGDGPGVGAAISRSPSISTWCRSPGRPAPAIEVARNAAPTVKRVERGTRGKSPNIVLDDEAFAKGVGCRRVSAMMLNSGQSCNAPSRMLVPNSPDG